jgi:hypothetical protein
MLPAAVPGFVRPALTVAWDLSGQSPAEHARSTLAEAEGVTDLVVLEERAQGELYCREMLFSEDGADFYAVHLHLRRGERSVLLALTGGATTASLLASAGRELTRSLA